MRIACQQTILMKYHALFVIFDKALLTLLIIGIDLNQTWPAFYDYIPVYERCILYTNVLKLSSMEIIFHTGQDISPQLTIENDRGIKIKTGTMRFIWKNWSHV